jgi:type IV pilus assembly protein PilQ
VSGDELIYDTPNTSQESPMPFNVSGGSNVVNLPVAGAAGQFALALFNSKKTQLLNLELSALEADGMGKTISSPRILTADQVEATIHDGERIPYLCASSSGATAICWANAFLALKVKPQITPDGRVLMTLKISKDSRGTDVSLGGSSRLPSVKTKEINSEVHVENGGTIVIGGVFELTESDQSTRVPFFGDLPYVGFLFKNKQRSEIKRELIIMITPKVVDDALAVKM